MKYLLTLAFVHGIIFVLLFVWPGEFGRDYAGSMGFSILTNSGDGISQAANNGVLYPLKMSITNSKGENIAVEILGRSATDVTFLRASDEKSFIYPLSGLSARDRARIESLPITTKTAQ